MCSRAAPFTSLRMALGGVASSWPSSSPSPKSSYANKIVSEEIDVCSRAAPFTSLRMALGGC